MKFKTKNVTNEDFEEIQDYMNKKTKNKNNMTRNPINEFKKESFYLFDSMIESFKDDIVKILFNIKIQTMSTKEFEEHKKRREQKKAN